MSAILEIGPDSQAFVLRMVERLGKALQQGHIAVGWSDARNLGQARDWEAFKSSLREAYPEPYPVGYADNNQALGNAAGSLWRFIHEMRVGDFIVAPAPEGFHVAVIEGQPYYDEAGYEEDACWRRKVRWLADTAVPRSHAGNTLQRRLKARQTCVDCTDLLDDLRGALGRSKPLTFNAAVIDAARDAVARCLHDAVNDFGLENVIARLASASGGRAEVQPKNCPDAGDVDVIAAYDLKISNQDSTIEVAYQVKQHEGVSDDVGIKQLIERMEQRPSIVRGCFVTTAESISIEARRLAADNDILVVTERDLVEWVLMVGLQALSD
jgi:predicted Mrr-cat superfamily restriction endonuclease